MKRAHLLVAVLSVLCYSTWAFPCSRMPPVSTDEMLRDANAIVRAVAVAYARPPANPDRWTTGEPDSNVRFEVLEVLRGNGQPTELVLPAFLSERDDFNDHQPPYTFVRPNGRVGSCFANTFRTGAHFLLFLKNRDGGYTVNWYALGPVDEQLRSEHDPWLLWAREHTRH